MHFCSLIQRRPFLQQALCLLTVLATGTVFAWPGNGGGGGGGKPSGNELIPVKVILMAGQSNMEGRGQNADLADLAPGLQQPQADVQIHWHGVWSDLQPGLGGQNTEFGPELTFGRAVADALPGENIVLIKYAAGGTNLAEDWNPSLPGSMWTGFVNAVNNALAALDPSVYDPQIVGMVWMQGERDSKFEEMALAYEQNLATFIPAVREQFGVPNLPFIIGQIHSKNTGDFKYTIQDAQTNVWMNTPNSGLVYTDDLSLHADLLHYDSRGSLDLGFRFADEVLLVPVAVDSIGYSIGGRGKKAVLTVAIAVGDEVGPVSGATVSVRIEHESGQFWNATGTTGSDGIVDISLSNPPAGCFQTTVTGVEAGILNWDAVTPTNGFCW